MVAPAVPLYGFQQRWIADRSRFKIGNICRQAGKSFMVSLEVVLDVIESGDLWVLLSAGERQSKELMRKVKMHLEALQAAASNIEEEFFRDTDITMLTITLPNGGRIIGLPANPETARGFSGNVVLDEFAFHRDSNAIWKALFPTVSRGYKLRVVSTPQGLGNRFHGMFTGENNFSKHAVDIHQAVADGVPHNIAELKEGIDDEDAWNQEYLCLFVDDASSWLSYEMIAACQHDKLPKEVRFADFDLNAYKLDAQGPLYLGWDFARHKHLSVMWLDEEVGDVAWARLIIVMQDVEFSRQEELAAGLLRKLPITRMCIDATGIGENSSEKLKTDFGAYRVEPVKFTNQVKADLAVRMRQAFEDRRCRIPLCKLLRDDLHAVRKTTTSAGNVRFDADATDKGHADRFWAGALAKMASNRGAIKPEIIWL